MKLKLVPMSVRFTGPSERFLNISRNIDLARNPPSKFEPTVKRADDVVI